MKVMNTPPNLLKKHDAGSSSYYKGKNNYIKLATDLLVLLGVRLWVAEILAIIFVIGLFTALIISAILYVGTIQYEKPY